MLTHIADVMSVVRVVGARGRLWYACTVNGGSAYACANEINIFVMKVVFLSHINVSINTDNEIQYPIQQFNDDETLHSTHMLPLFTTTLRVRVFGMLSTRLFISSQMSRKSTRTLSSIFSATIATTTSAATVRFDSQLVKTSTHMFAKCWRCKKKILKKISNGLGAIYSRSNECNYYQKLLYAVVMKRSSIAKHTDEMSVRQRISA